MRKQKYDEWDKGFVSFSHAVESWLFRLCRILLVLLVLFQCLLQIPAVRLLLSKVDQMEGSRYAPLENPLLFRYKDHINADSSES